MNEIIIREFENTKVEMAEINGEPMFEIYSTGMALGYLTSNGFAYKQRIDKVIENAEIIPTSHGVKSYFTEENLYDFMLEAKTEKIKPFRKWITTEVLPTIRKTGGYSVKQDSYMIENPIDRAERWIEEQKEKQLVIKENNILKPKAEYHDAVEASENSTGFGKFAGVLQNNKSVKIGRNKIMSWCRAKGYLCSSDSLKNKPSQQMLQNGYMEYKENVNERNGKNYITYTPLLTGKGQIWLTKKILEEYE